MWETIRYLDESWSASLVVSSRFQPNYGSRLLFLMIEWSLHGIPWILIAVLGTTWIIRQKQPPKVQWHWAVLAFGIAFDLACVGIIKIVFQRARPIYNKNDQIYEAPVADKYSFPSGHSSRAAMLAVIGLYFFGHKNGMIRYFLLLFPLILGLSRIAMGRHFISDVLAGFLLGYIEGLIVLQLPYESIPFLEVQFPWIFQVINAGL